MHDAHRRTMTLIDRLKERIAQDGPMSVAEFMTLALHDPRDGYYARHASIGEDGDFITAPAISQMFGELIGLWAAQTWMDMGSPDPLHVIELGPGTGAMMSDLLRASAVVPAFRAAIRPVLVEQSAVLREVQQARLSALGPPVQWISRLDETPSGAALVIGNEFLDCLPIRQFVRTQESWRERVIGLQDGALAFGLGAPLHDASVLPAHAADAPPGAVAEVSPALDAFVEQIARRLAPAGGRALFIDYGAMEPAPGDTLQAVRAHRKESPLAAPGQADLTAQVDFHALSALARGHGMDVHGPVTQGAWLKALGIDARTAALSRARPDKAAELARQRARLVDDEGMGALFKVVCLSTPCLPAPPGFDA